MDTRYEIHGDIVDFYIDHPKGKHAITHISIRDLESLLAIDGYLYLMPSKRQCRASIYFRGSSKSRPMLLHRFILNAPSNLFVDHIDHNSLNNTRDNLRLVTNAQNIQNLLHARSDSETKIRGVHRRKNGRYQAHAQVNGKRHFLGTFDCIADAEETVKNFRALYMPFSQERLTIKNPTIRLGKESQKP